MDNPWRTPEWMKAFEPYFTDTGALSVETLMNTYGAKCAARLVGGQARDEDVLDNRALVANAQVGLLTALKGAGLLRDPAADADSPVFLRLLLEECKQGVPRGIIDRPQRYGAGALLEACKQGVPCGWAQQRETGSVTIHSLVIGGVLCRWWGEQEPPGVKLMAALGIPPAPAEPAAKQ